jgi:hypothetical protein
MVPCVHVTIWKRGIESGSGVCVSCSRRRERPGSKRRQQRVGLRKAAHHRRSQCLELLVSSTGSRRLRSQHQAFCDSWAVSQLATRTHYLVLTAREPLEGLGLSVYFCFYEQCKALAPNREGGEPRSLAPTSAPIVQLTLHHPAADYRTAQCTSRFEQFTAAKIAVSSFQKTQSSRRPRGTHIYKTLSLGLN